MAVPKAQVRLSCAFCSTHKLVDLTELETGYFRCALCERISGVDAEALRGIVAGLSAALAAMAREAKAAEGDCVGGRAGSGVRRGGAGEGRGDAPPRS